MKPDFTYGIPTIPTKNPHDRLYLEYLRSILLHGQPHENRTGVDSLRVFGRQIRFYVRDGFPLLTTKKVFYRGVVAELLWFLSGSTNIQPLVQQGVSIWTDWPFNRFLDSLPDNITTLKSEFERRIAEDDEFAREWGELGPVYGKQWRNFNSEHLGAREHPNSDQITALIEGIKENPESRRHLVSAWNPMALPTQALPPCHYSFQVSVDTERGEISLLWNQRSVDSFLGLPFNIASYGTLLYMIGQQTGYTPASLIFSGGDCHIYENHIEQVLTQIERPGSAAPRLVLPETAPDSIFDYTPTDFQLDGYNPDPALKGKVAV